MAYNSDRPRHQDFKITANQGSSNALNLFLLNTPITANNFKGLPNKRIGQVTNGYNTEQL